MRPYLVVLAALLLTQTACVSLYVPSLSQGNVLTADSVAEVKIGMTRRQVRFVLGTPLIADPFHLDRWDYYYLYKPNSEAGKPRKEHLIVLFRNDQVSKLIRKGMPAAKVADSATP
jgi:outer membrane protein assembly factor BamE